MPPLSVNSLLEERFAETMATLEAIPGALAVACSGGPDSMALALLAGQWAPRHGVRCTALIVEHGVRQRSANEAQQTARWLAGRGIGAHILPVQVVPGAALQERARHARYQALLGWCQAYGCDTLLLAHHADDQAETLLLRLLAGSRLPGLAGMPLQRTQHGIALLRPLLGVRKARLADYLAARHQPFITDPSNDNPDFARVRVRRLLRAHSRATDRLWYIAQGLGRYRRALERWQQTWLLRHSVVYPYGIIFVSNSLIALPLDVQCDLLSRLLMATDGGEQPPRRAELERLAQALPRARTESLLRCLIIPHGEGWIVCREPVHAAPPAPLTDGRRWDRRFMLFSAESAGTPARPTRPDERQPLEHTIAALGVAGWSQVKDRVALDLPHPARLSLPAIWQLDAVVSLPHIWYDSTLSAYIPVITTFQPAKTLEESPFYAIPDSLIE